MITIRALPTTGNHSDTCKQYHHNANNLKQNIVTTVSTQDNIYLNNIPGGLFTIPTWFSSEAASAQGDQRPKQSTGGEFQWFSFIFNNHHCQS